MVRNRTYSIHSLRSSPSKIFRLARGIEDSFLGKGHNLEIHQVSHFFAKAAENLYSQARAAIHMGSNPTRALGHTPLDRQRSPLQQICLCQFRSDPTPIGNALSESSTLIWSGISQKYSIEMEVRIGVWSTQKATMSL